MIKWNVVLMAMSSLPNDIVARNPTLSKEEIRSMVRGAAIHFTPEISVGSKWIMRSDIHVQVNLANTIHYLFNYSGRTGQLESAQYLNQHRRWVELNIPQAKVG